MQYLSLDDWKVAARLPIPAGELMLSRLRNCGWIEIRGEKQHMAIKLTPTGLKAMRSTICHPPACRARTEGEGEMTCATRPDPDLPDDTEIDDVEFPIRIANTLK